MMHTELERVAEIVRSRSGLVLTADKGYLVDSRLAPLVSKEGYSSLSDLLEAVRANADERLAWAVTEAMTTNETFFFRDKAPFDRLADHMLPSLLAERDVSRPLRIWSAACSTGQEPYSIAMVLDANVGLLNGVLPEITATDISAKALEKAKSGMFTQFEIQRGLPVRMLVQYFEKSDEMWRVKPHLRSGVVFKRHNLMDSSAEISGPFDVVFCRNVLIYFDQETRRRVLTQLARHCTDDGYLVLGSAETLMGVSADFAPVAGKPGFYQKAKRASQAA